MSDLRQWRLTAHDPLSLQIAADACLSATNYTDDQVWDLRLGTGGVWAYWLTIIGEGLIEHGYMAEATDLVKRLLAAQIAILKEAHTFYEFYHADEPHGLGERGNAAGVVPLHLLMRVLGVRIVSSRKVWTGGPFLWGSPVTVSQHGIAVRRSAKGAQIRFPSGNTVDLPADAPFQEITDAQ